MITLVLHLFPLLILILILIIITTTAAVNPTPYTPTDLILINSGSLSPDTSGDGRRWSGDDDSKFCPFNTQTSPAFGASNQESVERVPYITARIIHSTITCTFPVLPGPKFLRLYFYPDSYSGYNTSSSFFTVTANDHTLLRNFSAYLTVSAKPQGLVKEFIVTAWDNQQLEVTFSPSPSSFAFINGIEIVSIPNGLYTKDLAQYTFVNSESNTFFSFDNTTSFETVYRLNVGGAFIDPVNDSGMFRAWFDDSKYIFGAATGVPHLFRNDVTIKYTKETPAYTAPASVYITKRTMGNDPEVNKKYNLTWIFPVDSGFKYLVRLHFCETQSDITGINDRLFFIFINNMTAQEEADVFYWSKGLDIPVCRDYVISTDKSLGNSDLWLALHPNMLSSPTYADAILNGVEIFKLNSSDGNLAGPNPELKVDVLPPEPRLISGTKKSKTSSPVVAIVGGLGAVIGLILVLSVIILFYRNKGREKKLAATTNKFSWYPLTYSSSSATSTLPLPTDLCHRFTMAEIRACTRNFSDQNVIGRGGFGTVYKGFIGNGAIPVAIKRLDSLSKQGIREFHTEIEMLSMLRHAHLVSLIGYCDDQGEMILVYEFMPNGNLQDHLYKTMNPAIPWKQRLKICIGAARGLHYLHTGAKHTIIHRDVKTSNILLDKNWVAKVSDFGLSKTGPVNELQTHVSTVVRGTFGYLDPEYYRRQQLTVKSDVYSFGVVLLEVLCARQPVISTLPREEVNLLQWARNCHQRGTLLQIIDQHLIADITPVSLNKFWEIVESCTRDKANERPIIGDIVWGLEFALQLQETAEENSSADDGVGESPKSSCRLVITSDDDKEIFSFSGEPTSDSRSTFDIGVTSSNSTDPNGLKSGVVFSELMNPNAR